jgi:hypothetical protein
LKGYLISRASPYFQGLFLKGSYPQKQTRQDFQCFDQVSF